MKLKHRPGFFIFSLTTSFSKAHLKLLKFIVILYYLLHFENTCFCDLVSYLALERCFGGAEALCIIIGGRKQHKQVN